MLPRLYGLWLIARVFERNADAARPRERTPRMATRGCRMLQNRACAHVRCATYPALNELDVPPRGNLLVLTLPAVEVFRSEEFAALDQWVRKGNTLLIMAALVDQPGWGARRASGAVAEIESLTGLEFESAAGREQRLDPTPLAQRVREADERTRRRER